MFDHLLNRAMAHMKECVTVIAILLLLPPLFAKITANTDPLLVLVGLGVASVAAYRIREHRTRRRPASPRRGAAERTPLLPHDGGGE